MFLLSITVGFVFLCVYKPSRYYIMSFFFPWLFNHKDIARFLGIRFESDLTWTTNRKDTQIYLTGVFARLFTVFTGMEIVTTQQTRKELMYLQGQFAHNITMEPYFDEIDGRTMTLVEFEDFLSKCLLVETNRVFNILDKEKEQYFLKHLHVLRTVINGLTGRTFKSIMAMFTNFRSVTEIIKIMKSVSEAQRMLLFVPHLSLIDGFSKMLIKTKGDMSQLQPADFFSLTSKYFVLLNHGDLVFLERHEDTRPTANNRAFLINGFSCPGSLFVLKVIKSIHEFLRVMNITVEGDAIIADDRFYNILNKDKIKVTFKKTDLEYHNDNTDFIDEKMVEG